MNTIHYLAYGSNLHPARIGERLGPITSLGKTELTGWGLRYHKSSADGSGKCNLVMESTEVAYGAVYEISCADKDRLDIIEGVGNGYRDVRIELPLFGDVWVYLAEPSHIDDELTPYDWYHAFVVHGARHHQFPENYIAEISNVVSVRDRDEQRRSRNLAILESIIYP